MVGPSTLAATLTAVAGSVVQSGRDGSEGPTELNAITRKQTCSSAVAATLADVELADNAFPACTHDPFGVGACWMAKPSSLAELSLQVINISFACGVALVSEGATTGGGAVVAHAALENAE